MNRYELDNIFDLLTDPDNNTQQEINGRKYPITDLHSKFHFIGWEFTHVEKYIIVDELKSRNEIKLLSQWLKWQMS